MTTVALLFKYPLNTSCQVGDIAYYIPANQNVGGFKTHTSGAEITKIGKILSINTDAPDANGNIENVKIQCEIALTTPTPGISDFILFSKSREVNESSMVGYYSALKFENDSKEPAELFVAACEYTGSS